MSNPVIILGLKKAALVIHALALKLDNPVAKNETMALVTVISDAVKLLEAKDA